MVLNVAGCNKESIVDGIGIRYTVFVQGCPHNCLGCHNPETHQFGVGTDLELEQICTDISGNPLLDGVTYSGGEPMCFTTELIQLSRMLRDRMGTDFNIWCYTGYIYEDLIKKADKLELLRLIDILVDGAYDISQRDLTLRFRGSLNQRVIDVQKSLHEHRVIELDI